MRVGALAIGGLFAVLGMSGVYSFSGSEQTLPAGSIALSDQCPSGFEKMVDGTCEFRSLYQLYPSIQNKGVGGLKSGLPDIRGGFSAKQIDLGRYLFFDPILSADGSISCASCHDPEKGFADGLDRSVGIAGEKVKRSAPSLWNVGFLPRLFWDERAEGLEAQAEGPLYDPLEMGNDRENLHRKINSVPAYRKLFADAFDRAPSEDIELHEIYTALAAFQSSLVSFNSRYDQYAHGFHDALTKNEIEGLNLFRSFVARCSECHTPPLFTNRETAVIVTPEPEGMPFDIGAEATYDDPTMRAAFKVPTLRNIARTAPYMHSGRFETMREAVKFYNDGRGNAVPEDEKVRVHWHIWEPNLREDELDRLVDFLKTLTDESFMPKVPDAVPSGLPLAPASLVQSRQKGRQPEIAAYMPEQGEK